MERLADRQAPRTGPRGRLLRVGPPGTAPVATLDPLRLGCGLGLATGLLEVAIDVAARKLSGGITAETLVTNHHYAWMIPTCNLAIFAAVGLALKLAVVVRDGKRVRFLGLLALAFLAADSVALAIPRIHGTATLILAAGASWQFAKALDARRDGVRRALRWGLPVMGLVTIGLVGIGIYTVSYRESRALAALPVADRAAPNVLLIVLDTVRADGLSGPGSARDLMPNLARLASRGVRFDGARSPAPWTLPAHASLFTGRWPHELSANVGSPLDDSDRTLAEGLADRGYASAAFVANTHNANSWYGLDRGFARYEDLYENTEVNAVEVFRSSLLGRKVFLSRIGRKLMRAVLSVPNYRYRKDAETINRDTLAWIADRGDRPFFAFLNYYDAHDPYVVPSGAAKAFAKAGEGRPRTAMEAARDDYDDCLRYLDDRLGHLIAEMERRGLMDNTLVVVTSDHGEGFGEHGLQGHGISLYGPEVRVPLFLVHPKLVPTGETIAEPVSVRDVAATIGELAGAAEPFPGRSLSRFWDRSRGIEGDREEPVLSSVDRSAKVSPLLTNAPARLGRMASLIRGGRILIRNGDGREELYDLAADPQEANDLAGDPASDAVLRRLREDLDTLMR